MIYLNCREKYEKMIDHPGPSEVVVKLKPEKKNKVRLERDLNP